EDELKEIECSACPGAGSCGGMYTANTMASAIEAMGMSLPSTASNPAESQDKKADCKDAGEAVYKLLEKGIYPKDIMTKKAFRSEDELKEIECSACPGAGSCGGMYTANTMASAIEAMGMSLPSTASNPAESQDKKADCKDAGEAVYKLLEKGIYPKDIMTKKAF